MWNFFAITNNEIVLSYSLTVDFSCLNNKVYSNFPFRPNFLPRITLANIWEPASRESCNNNFWEIVKASFRILFGRSTLQVCGKLISGHSFFTDMVAQLLSQRRQSGFCVSSITVWANTYITCERQHNLLSQASWGRLEMKPKRNKGHGSGTLISSFQPHWCPVSPFHSISVTQKVFF